jgi:hypothetical protein
MLPDALILLLTLAGTALATWALDILARKLSTTHPKNLKSGTPALANFSPPCAPPTKNVLHYVSEIVAYRVWGWQNGNLGSLNGERWLPNQRMSAYCSHRAPPGAREISNLDHAVPQLDCSCGIYAAKTFKHLSTLGYAGGIRGEVYLWGRMVEHKHGWRAQFAYPKTIILSRGNLPLFDVFSVRTTKEVENCLGPLTAYGADIFFEEAKEKVTVWTAHSGYDEAGLIHLLNVTPDEVSRMFARCTEKAKRVVFFAQYQASQFGSPYIEAEHLLLGLLREDKALTKRLLGLHASEESIQKRVEDHTRARKKISPLIDFPLTDACKRILAYSAEEADRFGHRYVRTEHMLIGLLREENSFAAQIRSEWGLQLQSAREVFPKSPE